MTYPAIFAILKPYVDTGRLRLWQPTRVDRDFVPSRLVLMAPEAWEQCPPVGEKAGKKLTGRMLANVRVALELFVGGEELVEGIDIKRLRPTEDEVWTLRVTEHPQIRVFGWFIERDVFLCSHIERRQMLSRSGAHGRSYSQEMMKTVRKRETQYSDLPCLRAVEIRDYVSNGAPYDLDD